jgi:hypothetical protein
MFTCRSVVLLLLLSVTFAVAQEKGAAGIDPMAGTGAIKGNVYTNTYFGFTFPVPANWRVLLGPDSIAAQGGCGKTQCRVLALQADKGIGRVTIDVHPIPAGGNAQALLTKAAEGEQAMGFQAAGAVQEPTSAGLKFYRQDLTTDGGSGGQILETLMAAQAKGDAVMITILTDSHDTLNQLASGVQSAGVADAKAGKAPK